MRSLPSGICADSCWAANASDLDVAERGPALTGTLPHSCVSQDGPKEPEFDVPVFESGSRSNGPLTTKRGRLLAGLSLPARFVSCSKTHHLSTSPAVICEPAIPQWIVFVCPATLNSAAISRPVAQGVFRGSGNGINEGPAQCAGDAGVCCREERCVPPARKSGR